MIFLGHTERSWTGYQYSLITLSTLLSAAAVGMKIWFVAITEICLQLLVCFPLCNKTACYYGIMSNKHILFFFFLRFQALHILWLGWVLNHEWQFLQSWKGTHLVHSAPALLFPSKKSAPRDKCLISVHLQDTKRKSINCTCSTNHHTLQTTYCNYVINRIC